MFKAYFLIVIAGLAGTALGLFLIKPYMRHITTRTQTLYAATLLIFFFTFGSVALYATFGAPFLMPPLTVWNTLQKEKHK